MPNERKICKWKAILLALLLLVLALVPGFCYTNSIGATFVKSYSNAFHTVFSWNSGATNHIWGIWVIILTLLAFIILQVIFGVHPAIAIAIAVVLLLILCLIMNFIDIRTPTTIITHKFVSNSTNTTVTP